MILLVFSYKYLHFFFFVTTSIWHRIRTKSKIWTFWENHQPAVSVFLHGFVDPWSKQIFSWPKHFRGKALNIFAGLLLSGPIICCRGAFTQPAKDIIEFVNTGFKRLPSLRLSFVVSAAVFGSSSLLFVSLRGCIYGLGWAGATVTFKIASLQLVKR